MPVPEDELGRPPLEPLDGKEEPEPLPEDEPLDEDDELEGTVLHAEINARVTISENLLMKELLIFIRLACLFIH